MKAAEAGMGKWPSDVVLVMLEFDSGWDRATWCHNYCFGREIHLHGSTKLSLSSYSSVDKSSPSLLNCCCCCCWQMFLVADIQSYELKVLVYKKKQCSKACTYDYKDAINWSLRMRLLKQEQDVHWQNPDDPRTAVHVPWQLRSSSRSVVRISRRLSCICKSCQRWRTPG